MSTANTPDGVRDADGLRVHFVEGGDPGDEVVAAITAVLTRPVVVLPAEDGATADEPGPTRTPWVRAARLEGLVHGRRITTRADLAWRRPGHGSA